MNINESSIKSVEKLFAEEASTPADPSWLRVQRGEAGAASAFLKDVEPTIVKAVNAYSAGDRSYMTQARIMAIEAAKTYNPERGASIDTHVYGQLRRLQRVSAQRGNLTRISENVAQQRAQVQRAIRELSADLGEEPTTDQIADKLGMSRNRINDLMNYKPIVPDSIAVSPEGDSLAVADVDKALALYDNVIYEDLDNIDKKIYEWSTGYGKGEKLSGIEIARRLNMSPAAVSKRYVKISQKFAEDRELIKTTMLSER